MRKFINKLLTFSLFGIVLFLIIIFLNALRVNNSFYKLPHKKYIFLGDSTFERGINPSLIKNSLNLSESGTSLVYIYSKLKALTQIWKPKKIVISMSSHNFFLDIEKRWLFNQGNFESRLAKYYPIMSKEEMNLFMNSEDVSIVLSTPIVLKKSLRNILRGNIDYGKYIPQKSDNLMIAKSELQKKENKDFVQIAKTEIKYLRKIVTLCKSLNIDILIVDTPKHPKYNHFFRKRNLLFKQFMEKEFSGSIYYDYSNLELEEDFFSDLIHLNQRGSRFFSKYLNEHLLDQ